MFHTCVVYCHLRVKFLHMLRRLKTECISPAVTARACLLLIGKMATLAYRQRHGPSEKTYTVLFNNYSTFGYCSNLDTVVVLVQFACWRNPSPLTCQGFYSVKSQQNTPLHIHWLGACHTVPVTEICACRPRGHLAFSLASKWARTCYHKRTCYSRWRDVKEKGE